MDNPQEVAIPVSQRDTKTRSEFILKTYNHLLGAIIAFVGIEIGLFKSGMADSLAPALASAWWAVLGGFILVSWIATHVAHKVTSLPMQYLALGFFVAAEALIFCPILWVAANHFPGAITSAAWVTGAGFIGLTAVAFTLRKDFSFLAGLLRWGGMCALLAIVASLVFGFTLGTWFSVGMVAFAGAAILYDTSNVIHHYPEDRYVAGSLSLFSSVMLLLWYILRIFMSRD